MIECPECDHGTLDGSVCFFCYGEGEVEEEKYREHIGEIDGLVED